MLANKFSHNSDAQFDNRILKCNINISESLDKVEVYPSAHFFLKFNISPTFSSYYSFLYISTLPPLAMYSGHVYLTAMFKMKVEVVVLRLRFFFQVLCDSWQPH